MFPSVNKPAVLTGKKGPTTLFEAKRWQGPPHINTVKFVSVNEDISLLISTYKLQTIPLKLIGS